MTTYNTDDNDDESYDRSSHSNSNNNSNNNNVLFVVVTLNNYVYAIDVSPWISMCQSSTYARYALYRKSAHLAGTDNQRRTPEKVSTIVLVRNALFLHGFKFLVIIFLIY